MQKAVWFSRHQPTPRQIEDAARIGYTLEVTPKGTALGTVEMKDNSDVKTVVLHLLSHCADVGAIAIFGVFPTPILGLINMSAYDSWVRQENLLVVGSEGDFPCFQSWNVARSIEGGKPTFEHAQWINIGHLNRLSCRWLK